MTPIRNNIFNGQTQLIWVGVGMLEPNKPKRLNRLKKPERP
jgi:hypothetical protein